MSRYLAALVASLASCFGDIFPVATIEILKINSGKTSLGANCTLHNIHFDLKSNFFKYHKHQILNLFKKNLKICIKEVELSLTWIL